MDYFNHCGVLRLDLRSDYETASAIINILTLMIEPAYDLFCCDKIATKAIASATERIIALRKLGFAYSENPLITPEGAIYDSYYVRGQCI